jgi:hypothetical protein
MHLVQPPAPFFLVPLGTALMNEPTGSNLDTDVPENVGDCDADAADFCVRISEVLQQHRSVDAVRLFLQRVEGQVTYADDLLDELRDVAGEKAVQRLVVAFAKFGCPYCRGGVDTCSVCGGSGRSEDPSSICRRCDSLGVLNCDFCGGSGLFTYAFVPESLRTSVAAARTRLVAAAIADDARRALPKSVAREQIDDLERTMTKRVLEFRRAVAILSNAAQFARELRARGGMARQLSARLFARASQIAPVAQMRAGRLFGVLAAVCRGAASITPDAELRAFELERADVFKALARTCAERAAHRSTLFPGRV